MYRNLLHFLYTNNEAGEGEIKKSVPFTTAPKTIRYLGINPKQRGFQEFFLAMECEKIFANERPVL